MIIEIEREDDGRWQERRKIPLNLPFSKGEAGLMLFGGGYNIQVATMTKV
jgi:hypothetical protein